MRSHVRALYPGTTDLDAADGYEGGETTFLVPGR